MVNFCRRFGPNATKRLFQLTDLLRGNLHKLAVTDAAPVAFSMAKSALAETTLLTHPSPSSRLV